MKVLIIACNFERLRIIFYRFPSSVIVCNFKSNWNLQLFYSAFLLYVTKLGLMPYSFEIKLLVSHETLAQIDMALLVSGKLVQLLILAWLGGKSYIK